jgi:hypothetical protein
VLYKFDEVTEQGDGAIFRKRSALLWGSDEIWRSSEKISIAVKLTPLGFLMFYWDFSPDISRTELRKAARALDLI